MTAINCSRVNVPLPTSKPGRGEKKKKRKNSSLTVMLPPSSYAAVIKAANNDVLWGRSSHWFLTCTQGVFTLSCRLKGPSGNNRVCRLFDKARKVFVWRINHEFRLWRGDLDLFWFAKVKLFDFCRQMLPIIVFFPLSFNFIFHSAQPPNHIFVFHFWWNIKDWIVDYTFFFFVLFYFLTVFLRLLSRGTHIYYLCLHLLRLCLRMTTTRMPRQDLANNPEKGNKVVHNTTTPERHFAASRFRFRAAPLAWRLQLDPNNGFRPAQNHL